jgi:hypothetical protein
MYVYLVSPLTEPTLNLFKSLEAPLKYYHPIHVKVYQDFTTFPNQNSACIFYDLLALAYFCRSIVQNITRF